MEMLLCTANRADDATLSGGDFTSGLPRDNLKDDRVTKVARTTSTDEADTRFRADLGANYTLRALALVNSNFSTSALWRVRAGQAPFDVLFDREGYVDERLTCSGGANGTRVNSLGVVVAATCPRIDHSPVNLASGTATQTLASVPAGRYVVVTVGAGSMVIASGTTLAAPGIAFPGNNGIVEVTATGSVTLTVTGSPTAVHFGEVYGVLVEEERTNKFIGATDYGNAAWNKANVTLTSNNVLAPDGTMTGTKVAATATTFTSLNQTVTAAATSETMYFIAKQGNLATNVFVLRNDTTATDLVAGTLTWATKSISGSGASIEEMGNGWIKVILVATTGITVGDTLRGYFGAAGGPLTAADYYYAWHSQSEAGAAPTSNIPTTSAAVTRSADASTATSTNFSSWYNQTAGTFYAEFIVPPASSSNASIFSVDDATTDEFLQLVVASNGHLYVEVYDGGVNQALVDLGAVTPGAKCRVAVGYEANHIAASLNGASAVVDTSCTLPTPNRLTVGSRLSTNYLNSRILRLEYWSSRWGDAVLATLSTSGPDIEAVGGWCSGVTACKQMTFYGDTPSDWAAQYPAMVAFSAVSARYATVELIDTANADGYVQMGRLFVGGGMAFDNEADSQGFAFDREELSTVQQTATGRRIGYERRRPRGVVFRLPAITQAQSDQIHEMQALVGTIGEVLLVTDTDDMAFSQRYGGIGYLRDLSPIEYPLPDNRSVAFSWREKL